jgi:biopolymer transport protein ExbD
MARREGEEISAGSMADIAFLLLIFFIVTTTMELEAGIPQQLAMKVELPPDFKPPDVKQRDVFSISINANDQLRVENEAHEVQDLSEMVYSYFTSNMYSETNVEEARYVAYTVASCKEAIKLEDQKLVENPEDIMIQSRLLKWEKRLMVCEALADGGYREIHETAVVQVKQKAKTSYGMYIAVVNEVKKIVNQVRDEKCKEIFNGLSYYDLDLELDEDQEKLKILRILVPERIIEPAIKN